MTATAILDAGHPVARQLVAYNARDIDAFMACWADDCEYYEFPGRLLARGADQVRQRHLERFKEANLHGRLIGRIALGDLVVDEEMVTRSFADGPGEVRVVAIYQAAQGRIARAWFKTGQPQLHGTVLEPARAADAAAVRALVRDAYAKWIPAIGREPRPMLADQEAAIRDHRVDVVRIEGVLAGVVEMIPAGDHLLIENVAVSPAFQRRGIGRGLLAHAERVAVGLGLSVLRLYTNPLFAGNVRLYHEVGYVTDREEPFMGGTTIHMSKRLGAAPA